MIFSEDQLERYSRQFVLPSIGVAGQKKLLAAKVLVIGAGALGSAALLYLAAAGVGTIGIADYDAVELSNLQRQVVHRTDRVGTGKVQSAADTVKALNPEVEVRMHEGRVTPDNIMELIAPYDFIVDGTDRFETKLLINDACVIAGKPFSHAGIVRLEGQAMTYVPGRGPCLRCIVGEAPPAGSAPTCAEVGVVGAATGIMGSIQALETIKYITGAGELLVGRILHFDGLSMEFTYTEVKEASPHCRVCGSHPEITDVTKNSGEYEVLSACHR